MYTINTKTKKEIKFCDKQIHDVMKRFRTIIYDL